MALLGKDRSRLWFIDALNRSNLRFNIACWAYVIMPEHVHLLALPGPVPVNLSSWVSSLKRRVTHAAVKYLSQHNPNFLTRLLDIQPSGRKSYRFWQPGGGVDVNRWTDAKIWDKIDYIHNNPVRRGLVTRPADFEWSSYRDYVAIRQVGRVVIDWRMLPEDPRRE